MSNELTERAYYYENEKSKKKQTIINYAEYYSHYSNNKYLNKLKCDIRI